MTDDQKFDKPFSTITRTILLAPSVILALAIYMANSSQTSDDARLMGYATAPFVLSLMGVGLVWIAKKIIHHKEGRAFKKRPFIDYFILWSLIITILAALSRIGQNTQY